MCPAHPSNVGERNPELRFDYRYDGFQRLLTARSWAVDAGVLREVDEGRHTYDVLDRPLTQGESHNFAGIDPNAAPARSTTFGYLGLTNGIVQEQVSGQSATTGNKDYRYDAFGTRTTLNASGQRFGYGYDGSCGLDVGVRAGTPPTARTASGRPAANSSARCILTM